MKQKKVVGIDFGGTKIKFAVVSETGEILGEEILLATESHRSAKKIVETMKDGINKTYASIFDKKNAEKYTVFETVNNSQKHFRNR